MGNGRIPYEDGRHVIYVNAEASDGSPAAELMRYFKTANADDDSQGALSERVRFLKRDKGGERIMCKVMDEFMGKYVEQASEMGHKAGINENKVKTAWNMFDLGMPLETISKVVEESVSVVEQWLQTSAVTK